MDNEITFEIFQAGEWRTAGSMSLPQQMQVLGVDEATIQTFAPGIQQAGRKLQECTDG